MTSTARPAWLLFVQGALEALAFGLGMLVLFLVLVPLLPYAELVSVALFTGFLVFLVRGRSADEEIEEESPSSSTRDLNDFVLGPAVPSMRGAIPPPPAGPAEQRTSRSSLWRWASWAAVAVTLVLVIGGFGGYWFTQRLLLTQGLRPPSHAQKPPPSVGSESPPASSSSRPPSSRPPSELSSVGRQTVVVLTATDGSADGEVLDALRSELAALDRSVVTLSLAAVADPAEMIDAARRRSNSVLVLKSVGYESLPSTSEAVDFLKLRLEAQVYVDGEEEAFSCDPNGMGSGAQAARSHAARRCAGEIVRALGI